MSERTENVLVTLIAAVLWTVGLAVLFLLVLSGHPGWAAIVAIGLLNINMTSTHDEKEETRRIELRAAAKRLQHEDLVDLILHMQVHSGYARNGYMQMTTEQKQLYDQLERTEL